MNLEKYYTPEELERLLKKYRRKQNNARKRDIEFNLSWEEYLLFGKKLLGEGVCDYTLIPFDMHTDENGLGNPFYPSLERIDDEGPYAVDNCCVVGLRCNSLKDCLVDKKTAVLIKDKTDRKIVQQMMLHLSEERMEKLKGDYTFEDFILQYGTEEDKLALFDEEWEEDMSPMQDFKNFMANRGANKHISDIVNEPVVEEIEEMTQQDYEEEKEPQEAMTSKILRKIRPTAVHLQKQLLPTVLLWKQKESLSLTTERLFLLTIQPLQADIPLMPVLYGTKIYPT